MIVLDKERVFSLTKSTKLYKYMKTLLYCSYWTGQTVSALISSWAKLNLITQINFNNIIQQSTHHTTNSISIEVMLSRPFNYPRSLAIRQLNSFYMLYLRLLEVDWHFRICSIILWLLFTYFYHIPSQPMMINLSYGLLSISMMFGTLIMGCQLYFFLLAHLNQKSPKALDKLRF